MKIKIFIQKARNYISRRIKKIFIPVSIPAYKKIALKGKEEFYENEINSIIINAENFKLNAAKDFKFTHLREMLKDYHRIHSVFDKLGDVLIKIENGGKKVYRGIVPEKAAFFKELYGCGVLQALAEAGRFVSIKPTNFYTKDYPLIIEIETLCVVPSNYWSFSMIRESAINLIVINTVLKHFGYVLLDGHFGNSTFKNYNPIFFDIGSVVKSKKDLCIEEFKSFYLNTLLMISVKKSFFAKYCIIPYRVRTLPDPININESLEMQAVRNIFFKFHANNSSKEYNTILKKVFKNNEIKAEYIDILFEKRPKEKSTWESYSHTLYDQQEPGRRRRILELIKQFSSDAKSCLDIAGNAGYFSSLLDKTGQFRSIFNIDYDENAVEYGREQLKDEKIAFYLVNPFIPFGDIDKITSSVKSDIVFALALTHHLILTQNYLIGFIFSTISMYTKKYVYIEFCPLGLYGGGNTLPEIPLWYTKEWFEENFKNYFDFLHKEVIETIIINNKEFDYRILFIGKK